MPMIISKARDLKPFRLDNNEIIIINEFVQDKNLVLTIILVNFNNKVLELTIEKKFVFEKKTTILERTEKLNYCIYNPTKNSDIFDVESDENYRQLMKNCFMVTEQLFQNKEHLDDFIEASKVASRIDFYSKEFFFPIEFIHYETPQPNLLGELTPVYRKYKVNNFPKDGAAIEQVRLAYVDTERVDSKKEEFHFFENLDKDVNKPFKFNYISDADNVDAFFKCSQLSDSNIIHLSCHIDYNENNPSDSCLVFKDFNIYLSDIVTEKRNGTLVDKILFLNGCNILKSQNGATKSTFSYFFESGIVLLISTGAEILDEVAIKFTLDFYDYFLEPKEKRSIQGIIHHIAKDFWVKDKNPIGFFYHTIGPIITN